MHARDQDLISISDTSQDFRIRSRTGLHRRTKGLSKQPFERTQYEPIIPVRVSRQPRTCGA